MILNYALSGSTAVLEDSGIFDIAFSHNRLIAFLDSNAFGYIESELAAEEFVAHNREYKFGDNVTWDQLLGVMCFFDMLVNKGLHHIVDVNLESILSLFMKARCELYVTYDERRDFIVAVSDLLRANFYQTNKIRAQKFNHQLKNISIDGDNLVAVFLNSDMRVDAYNEMARNIKKGYGNDFDTVKFIEAKQNLRVKSYYGGLRNIIGDTERVYLSEIRNRGYR